MLGVLEANKPPGKLPVLFPRHTDTVTHQNDGHFCTHRRAFFPPIIGCQMLST
jgi:hypothetical protein